MRRGNWARHPMVIGHQNNPDVVRAMWLEGLGMSRSSIYRRCRPDGPWRRLLPGIIRLHPREPTDEQRLEAALLLGGDRAMVTGLWAARRHGLTKIPEPGDIHLLVPDVREVTSTGFVVVERTTRLPGQVLLRKIPVAPVYRAVLDAARRMRDVDTIQTMLAEAVQRDRCTPQALAKEPGQGSQRGSALPRLALGPLLGGAESVAESDGMLLWQRSGLPPAEWNVVIVEDDGAFVAKPDAWCDKVAFAWEIDSRSYHAAGDDYAETLARNARYAAAGIVVLQTLPARLRTDPEGVLRELRAAYAAASRRPRPPVRRR